MQQVIIDTAAAAGRLSVDELAIEYEKYHDWIHSVFSNPPGNGNEVNHGRRTLPGPEVAEAAEACIEAQDLDRLDQVPGEQPQPQPQHPHWWDVDGRSSERCMGMATWTPDKRD